jgi:zinc/manganese transport system ATP-binding protein
LNIFRSGRLIVKGLDLEISQGTQVAIVGPNGGGKSTFLSLLAHPVSKTFHIQGILKRHYVWQRDVAYLPQLSQAQRHFPLLVRDVVAAGLWRELGPLRPLGPSHRRSIEEALQGVGLAGLATRSIGALSGGQFQRVLFARLSIQNAPLLLLDEPFNGVDMATQEDLMGLLQTWQTQGKTILVVLHDLGLVRRAFSQVLLLARDFSRFGRVDTVLTPENLEKAGQQAQLWQEEGEA